MKDIEEGNVISLDELMEKYGLQNEIWIRVFKEFDKNFSKLDK